MKISLNELSTTLEKLFETFHYSTLDYADSANIVYWTELLKLGGLRKLVSSLKSLKNEHLDRCPEILYESDSIVLFDFFNNSCLFMSSSVIDFTIVKSLKKVEFITHLQNCKDRLYLISKLLQFKSHNLHAVLKWVNNQYTNYAWIPLDSDYPKHIKIKNQFITEYVPKNCLIQVTQKKSIPFHMFMNMDNKNYNPSFEIKGENFKLENVVKNGLEVNDNDWSILLEYAKDVLVKSSSISQQQAGESFEKDLEDV